MLEPRSVESVVQVLVHVTVPRNRQETAGQLIVAGLAVGQRDRVDGDIAVLVSVVAVATAWPAAVNEVGLGMVDSVQDGLRP